MEYHNFSNYLNLSQLIYLNMLLNMEAAASDTVKFEIFLNNGGSPYLLAVGGW